MASLRVQRFHQWVPGVGWRDPGCRKQMLVLEQLQHVQRTSDPVSAHEQRGRKVVDVIFKCGESYKKHTCRTEP